MREASQVVGGAGDFAPQRGRDLASPRLVDMSGRERECGPPINLHSVGAGFIRRSGSITPSGIR